MSVNTVKAARQSRIAHRQSMNDAPMRRLSVNEYTVDEVNFILDQVEKSRKVARKYLDRINTMRAAGWGLDSFHWQLRQLCIIKLYGNKSRRRNTTGANNEQHMQLLVTPTAAVFLN
jgi:hypothetical protein